MADEHRSSDAQIYAEAILLKVEVARGDSATLAAAPDRLRRLLETIDATGHRSTLLRVLALQIDVCERLDDQAGAERARHELDAARAEMLAPTTFDL